MLLWALIVVCIACACIYAWRVRDTRTRTNTMVVVPSKEHRASGGLPYAFDSCFDDMGIRRVDYGCPSPGGILFCRNSILDTAAKKMLGQCRNIGVVYGLASCNVFADKRTLAQAYRHGCKHVPATWTSWEDVPAAPAHRVYVLKKNLQRQQGIRLAHSRDDMKSMCIADPPDVIQEGLEDPFLVAGRKINLRIYVLVMWCPQSGFSVHVHRNGFVYYCRQPMPASMGDTTSENYITTGYIDRSVYDHNPLTVAEFLEQHVPTERHSAFWSDVTQAVHGVTIGNPDALRLATIMEGRMHPPGPSGVVMGVRGVVMGADIAVSSGLGVAIMELNRGPDMDKKDDRDGEVKRVAVQKLCGILTGARCTKT